MFYLSLVHVRHCEDGITGELCLENHQEPYCSLPWEHETELPLRASDINCLLFKNSCYFKILELSNRQIQETLTSCLNAASDGYIKQPLFFCRFSWYLP